MRIGFVSADWSILGENNLLPGGAGYYRCALPAAGLNEFSPDIEAFHVPQFRQLSSGEIQGMTMAGEVFDNLDMVIYQRWMSEMGVEVSRSARACGQIIVQDIDDAYFSLRPSNQAFAASHPRPKALAAGRNRSVLRKDPVNRAARRNSPGANDTDGLMHVLRGKEGPPPRLTGRPGQIGQVKTSLTPDETGVNRNNYWKTLGAADYITTSTPYLASRLERTGRPVIVLPNMIDLRLWGRQEIRDTRQPTVGWVGAVPWRSGDLETVRNVISAFIKRHGLKFIHGGHHPQARAAAELLGLDPETTENRWMVTIDKYPELWQGIDIGICPLSDTPFNRAKSAIKRMEGSAAGVPCVAQKIDPYTEYGVPYVARRAADWTRYLEQLIDPAERQRVSDLSYERVQAEDVHVRWKDWANLYTSGI